MRLSLVLAAALAFATTAPAQTIEVWDIVGRGPTQVQVGPDGAATIIGPATAPAFAPTSSPSLGNTTEALGEVNAARARRGLPPFARDDSLTQGAAACAQFRASRGIQGHVT